MRPRALYRSTKAGASTPATRESAAASVVLSRRSTKAGASTPATPRLAALAARGVSLAQRRPERQPRRHPVDYVTMDEFVDAQRRPERQPRRHSPRGEPAHRVGRRSTKAGASTPATLVRCQRENDARCQRSTKAGASTPATPRQRPAVSTTIGLAQRRPERQPRRHSVLEFCVRIWSAAQRRPERQPRRHSDIERGGGVDECRSTKAGASTPATLEMVPVSTTDPCAAQRRPERQPRRHNLPRMMHSQEHVRSTKAGASTPATHGGELGSNHVEHGRSTKAGASTPATQLNRRGLAHRPARSTKAGASTPATRAWRPRQ